MKYNPNDALRDRFILSIPEHSDVALKVRSSPVPNVSTEGVSIRGSNDPFMAHLDGDMITYAPVVWTFTVDEDLENYYKIFKWMISNATTQEDIRYDGTMSIMSSAGVNVLRRIKFEDLYPIDLSEIDYGIDDDQGTTLTCTVTMRYTKFDVVGPFDTPYNPISNYYDTVSLSTSTITSTVSALGSVVEFNVDDPKIGLSIDENGYLVLEIATSDPTAPGQDLVLDDDNVVYFEDGT